MFHCKCSRWVLAGVLLSFGIFFSFLSVAFFQLDTPNISSDTIKQHLSELKQKKYAFLADIDTTTDDSLYKFVHPDISFNEKSYIPENLVKINSEYVFDTKGYSTLRTEANEALQSMAKAFQQEFGIKLTVVSAYRSYAYQKGIKDRGCPDNLCAKAGHSEHQSGLGVDFFRATTQADWLNDPKLSQYFDWLSENAHLYGFHNTYQLGIEIDGYEIEPWHWRYMGAPLAGYLKDHNITFAQWVLGK
ncbi:M15 family metallopeptidase [Candidatus Gracilibacteria bacterium]|nr:M15 family metallopeptidase [Candidatus Gracilibacteria bacterium]